MHLAPTLVAFLAVLSFSSTSTATENVIRVPLERKSFITHTPDHKSRSLATRVNNAAGHVNVDFLKTHVARIAM